MLESMVHEPRPTRAEASDVANAVIDGTDAIMLSGETAMGDFPVKAVEMMDRIAMDVEAKITFRTYPPDGCTNIQALGESANLIAGIIQPACIAVLTTSGRSARFVAAERPKVPVFALTTHKDVYHALNLLWGVKPLFIEDHPDTVEEMVAVFEKTLTERKHVVTGDKVLLLAGIPAHVPGGTNFIMILQV
jgi:pyruvate kinase